MKTGDLVRFKSSLLPKEVVNQWQIGLLIEYLAWERIGTILYEGKIFRIMAENIQKAGKKDFEDR